MNAEPGNPDSIKPTPTPDRVAQTLAYHHRTKHRLHQYARSLGYLDWSTQPDPFRAYTGARRTDLPLTANGLSTRFTDLYRPRTVPVHPLAIESVAALLELSLGLSVWKQYRASRWALRCNPSSGNLHPTEGYVIVPALPGLPTGVHHYVSRDHCLEQRCDAAPVLPPGTLLVGLSSIHWREAWKYGERAFRYCQHDIGHAIGAVRFAAAALGWSVVLLDHLGDATVAGLLDVDHTPSYANVKPPDREQPEAILLISTGPVIDELPAELSLPGHVQGDWTGEANPLSPDHVAWPVIEHVAVVTSKPATRPAPPIENASLPPLRVSSSVPAERVIRQRRSCLGLDGTTFIDSETLYTVLDHLLPRSGVLPWDALPWKPQVHVGLFVHRVRGLMPGLYVFERSPLIHPRLKAAMRTSYAWTPIAGCPEHLRLFLLEEGDFRSRAHQVSCHQDITSDGAFSLGMIAEFSEGLSRCGAWWYRRLFWEAGVLGHVLSLEAEAAGFRGTGIGCYFDDALHDLLGLRGEEFQDLYQFTVGAPVEDPRLTTLPPYAHLNHS